MPQWSNWSGKLKATPSHIHFPRSEQDAAAIAAHANQNAQRIRVAGACHSHAPLVQHNEVLVDPQGLNGVIDVNQEEQTAWVYSGTRIHALGAPLHKFDLALKNQGDIDQQAICGATATGTHGTGISLQNLSTTVVGAVIATAAGDLVTCDAQQNSEIWQASRLHLGAFGIITQLKLQLREAYKLSERTWQAGLDETLSTFAEQSKLHRHLEFFWYPQTDTAQCKSIDETDAEPIYPLAQEGQRCAWSYEVLPNHRPHKHTEMEYAIPAEHGPACMAAIRDLLRDEFADVRWPVEYRTLAKDDVWMSPAYQRDTVTLSVHQDINENDEPYFRACESIFLQYDGRPHWGKVNYLDNTTMPARHDRWADWWQVRDSIDPKGTFLNDYLRGLQ